jgi:aspartyl protease family protein
VTDTSLTTYLIDQPIIIAALAGLLVAGAGWMVEQSRPRLAQRLRMTGYLSMLGAGALIVVDVARKAEHSDAKLDLMPTTEARVSGAETIIPLGADGHYHAQVSINGQKVAAMIDTGATFTSFEESVASKLGLTPSQNRLPTELQTANGIITARFGIAREMQLGNIAVKDAEIAITPDTAAPQGVIGMDLLSRLASWRVENGELHLQPPR